jgi:hypothetical protein
MKPCPSCRSELPDNALTCPQCGGSWQPDGSFKTPWDVEMARMVGERERKVQRAQRFGAWGKPHTHFFLEKESGCLVGILIVAITLTLIAGGLALAAT